MSLFEIIKRPIITEKALDQKEDQGILCFEVQIWANKQEVKKAIEKLFSVKVASVRQLVSKEKNAVKVVILDSNRTGKKLLLSLNLEKK